MKRLAYAVLAAGVIACMARPAQAYTGTYTPGTGINNTVHDLGTAHNGMNYVAAPADPLGRLCIYCHAPHNTYKLSAANGGPGVGVGAGPEAPDDFTYLPLWNHTLNPALAYVMYDNGPGAPQSGPRASQAIINGMVPGSSSLLCLSCHDGTIAVNSWGNGDQRPQSISTGSTLIANAYAIGKDQYLGNHHPIGFDVDQVVAADPDYTGGVLVGGVRSPDAAMLTPTEFVRDHLYGPGNTQMECGTCHSVHNVGNNGEALLWRSDQNSELCLTCHAKGIYTAP
jgi:predicted CXXCH cytochrome family protein